MRRVLLHHHIFKNAGSSVVRDFNDAFGSGFLAYDSDNPRGVIPERQLLKLLRDNPEVKALSSHQSNIVSQGSARECGLRLIQVLLLRRPLARIVSMYDFERSQQATTPGAIHAGKLGLAGYLQWRLQETPWVVKNFQTYFCARGDGQEVNLNGNPDLDRAVERLRNVDVVGVVEAYEAFARHLGRQAAEWAPELKMSCMRSNISSGWTEESAKKRILQEAGGDVLNELERANHLDTLLWEKIHCG